MGAVVTRDDRIVDDPPFLQRIFNDTRWSWIYVPLRLYLASVWIPAGWGTLTNPAWWVTGAAPRGFWERALADPDAISQGWYRSFLQLMLDAHFQKNADLTVAALDAALAAAALTGCTGRSRGGEMRTSGIPVVSDPLPALTGGIATEGALERHAESFFQANRFLLPKLVEAVMHAIPLDGAVLDLYAGVGLFSVCLAASGRTRLSAVEGDRTSGKDLTRNAAAYAGALRVSIGSVEEYLARHKPRPSTVLVDPPRTGMSREAMQAIVAIRAARVVYVSCDPATMARDARRLLDGGYDLASLQAFDLFPNTPHVESLGVFVRRG